VTDDIAEWDAAYVLGALSCDDRQLYETYLTENPARGGGHREEVGHSAGLDV